MDVPLNGNEAWIENQVISRCTSSSLQTSLKLGTVAPRAAWLLQDRVLVQRLIAEGQAHLFSSWPPPGEHDDDKRRMLGQLRRLDSSYAGGLVQYIANARRLLQESKQGLNPFEGCVPSVPDGERLDFGSDAFRAYERKGERRPRCL